MVLGFLGFGGGKPCGPVCIVVLSKTLADAVGIGCDFTIDMYASAISCLSLLSYSPEVWGTSERGCKIFNCLNSQIASILLKSCSTFWYTENCEIVTIFKNFPIQVYVALVFTDIFFPLLATAFSYFVSNNEESYSDLWCK